MTTKYIFFTGGVVSSVGKGVTAAALGRVLKQRGFSVAVQKLDPYINVDPGTMSPYQHGEVFVLDDGAETDLDLGHYERFIDIRLEKYAISPPARFMQKLFRRNGAEIISGVPFRSFPISQMKSNAGYCSLKRP